MSTALQTVVYMFRQDTSEVRCAAKDNPLYNLTNPARRFSIWTASLPETAFYDRLSVFLVGNERHYYETLLFDHQWQKRQYFLALLTAMFKKRSSFLN